MSTIPINLGVEDRLSEAIARRLLRGCSNNFHLGTVFQKGGFGYLRRMAPAFNNAAKGIPFLLLTDLDTGNCAPDIINEWLPKGVHPNLLFRVAIREVEAWILADCESLSRFLGLRNAFNVDDPDLLENPKAYLIDLARHSPRREIRDDIVPRRNSTSRIGPNYNGRLSIFVEYHWQPLAAAVRSKSLAKSLLRLAEFMPTWMR